MVVAQVFIYFLLTYFLVGLLYGTWFVLKGADRIDSNMVNSGWKLRLLLLPASIALWPLLIKNK